MELFALAKKTGLKLKEHNLTLTTAESCTGGGIAFAITQIDGSSQWFDRGFVTYSNEAKQEMLAVDSKLLDVFGAVSEEVALAMAKGALANSKADISIAITGIAGPQGGTPLKPVGTVWLAFAGKHLTAKALLLSLKGDRAHIRTESIRLALENLLALL
jgi:nicotinamide-nucleotide amidase